MTCRSWKSVQRFWRRVIRWIKKKVHLTTKNMWSQNMTIFPLLLLFAFTTACTTVQAVMAMPIPCVWPTVWGPPTVHGVAVKFALSVLNKSARGVQGQSAPLCKLRPPHISETTGARKLKFDTHLLFSGIRIFPLGVFGGHALVSIGQTVAEILRFYRFPKWRSPPSWIFKNSNFYRLVGLVDHKCISLPNFIKIGQSIAEIWQIFDFSRWRPSAMLDF